jgi:hypothetical protein
MNYQKAVQLSDENGKPKFNVCNFDRNMVVESVIGDPTVIILSIKEYQ